MNAVVPAKIKSQRSDSQNSPHEVRAAYPYFHEKRTKNAAGVPFTKKDGSPNPRYSSTLMFPKQASDAAQCPAYAWLWSLAVEAAKKMWPQNVDDKGNWVWPAGAQYPVKDGDVPFTSKPKPGQPVPSPDEIAKKNAWRKGYWIVEVENFLDPGPRIAKLTTLGVTDVVAKVVNGVAQYKSGDWGIPNLHAYAYQNETFGINYGFDGFLFTREGEAIGSSGPRSATQMFGSVAGMVAPNAPAMPYTGAPTAPPAMPTAPVAPSAAVAPQPTYAAPPAAPVSPQPTYAAPASPAPPAAPMPTYAAPPVAPMTPPAPPSPGLLPPLPVR